MGGRFDRSDIYPHWDTWILTLKGIHAEGLQQRQREQVIHPMRRGGDLKKTGFRGGFYVNRP